MITLSGFSAAMAFAVFFQVPGAFQFVRYCTGISSVSYTHLRAHETVLDIVCRLLLEKKNNTKTLNVVIVILHQVTMSTDTHTIINTTQKYAIIQLEE